MEAHAKAVAQKGKDDGPPSPEPVGSGGESIESGGTDIEKAGCLEGQAHVDEFLRRTKITPRQCYRLVLLLLALRICGSTWMGMVMLEYARYYIINDLNWVTAIETATGSPQCLLKAFFFPFWGVAADRTSRRKIIVIATAANCLSAWFLTVIPSIEIFVLTRCLTLVGDIGGSIRNALLRDIFSPTEWERMKGGVTGIKSRMAVFGLLVTAFAVAVGMGLLKMGEFGYGLENEYTVRKAECAGRKFCVPRGQYSWGTDGWQVDGSLRLLMLMAASVLSLELLVVTLFLPETLRPEYRREASLVSFIRRNWRKFGTPWNNLRVFATAQLQALASIRFLHYIIGSGGTSLFMSWYRRHELDSFTIYSLGVASGTVGFFIMFGIVRLVDRFGDLRGIWIPSNVCSLLYGLSVCLIPAELWQISYVIFPAFGAPAGVMAGFTPELLAKLIPPDVQGTFQTAKSFLYDIQKAVFVWPWLGIYIGSEGLPYPLDTMCVWVALVLGCVALHLKFRQLPNDPKAAIEQGRALDAFWETAYVRGQQGSVMARPWYRRHGGRLSTPASGPQGTVPELQHRAITAEGTSKVGLFLTSAEDLSFQAYLVNLSQQLPKAKSLSVVLCFIDGEDALGHNWGTPKGGSGSAREFSAGPEAALGAMSADWPEAAASPSGVRLDHSSKDLALCEREVVDGQSAGNFQGFALEGTAAGGGKSAPQVASTWTTAAAGAPDLDEVAPSPSNSDHAGTGCWGQILSVQAAGNPCVTPPPSSSCMPRRSSE